MATTLCEVCKKRDASVISTPAIDTSGAEGESDVQQPRSMCKSCADSYYASTPGLNSARDLIRLSDSYRSKLYDLLEAAHPEAFDNQDTEACVRGSELMCKFLKKQLKKDRMDIRGDAFDMLCKDFFGSRKFYERADEFNGKKKR